MLLKHAVIEDASIELLELFDKVSVESIAEKGPANILNQIHYWWTRKPLIVGRAMLLASTLDDIDSIKPLLGINKDSRAYKKFPNLKTYEKYLGCTPSSINVLDPFGGGGNLIFESMRLGLNSHVSDYNPVAHIIEKSILQYPGEDQNLAKDFEKYANNLIQISKKK